MFLTLTVILGTKETDFHPFWEVEHVQAAILNAGASPVLLSIRKPLDLFGFCRIAPQIICFGSKLTQLFKLVEAAQILLCR